MSRVGILMCFYQNEPSAKAALRVLRRRGFPGAALVHKSADGRVRIDSVSPRRGAVFGIVAGLGLGLLIGLLFMPLADLVRTWTGWLDLAVSVVLGGAGGWLVVRYLRLGFDEETLEKHGRWLVQQETLLLAQASARSMSRAISLLRASGEGEVTIFALHPSHRGLELTAEPIQHEPLTGHRLKQHARRLAEGHQVHPDVSAPAPKGEPLLDRLAECEWMIEQVRRDLSEAAKLEQAISQASEWLLDNAYIVQGHISDVRRNLSTHFYHELPVLAAGSGQGDPRVYALSREMILHTDARLDPDTITDFLGAYQEVCPLTIGELWALPLMLRIAMIETVQQLARQADLRLHQRELADFWANRLLTAARRDPDQLLFMMAELGRENPDAGPYFALQLTGHLYDEEAALIPVQSWIERKLSRSLSDILTYEQGLLAAAHVSTANAITSLRNLSLLDWRDIFESHSRVEAILAQDPSGVYPRMDFDTRDHYRHAVEEIARRSERSETEVAELAVQTAAESRGGDARLRHVGYHLVDEGRPAVEAAAGCRPRLRQRLLRSIYRHHTGLYLGGIGLTTVLAIAAALALAHWTRPGLSSVIVVGLLAVLPASELAVRVMNYLVTRVLPPRTLSKMSFEDDGIPDHSRTLVVVPMMLLTRPAIRQQVDRLQTLFLANPDPNLLFSLFADFCDGPQQHCPGDEELLQEAVDGIEELNRRHDPGRFLLFHRPRTWTECEQSWIGWERKRGKLEELNRLLTELGPPSPAPSPAAGGRDSPGREHRGLDRNGVDGDTSGVDTSIVRVGNPAALADVRYVITLDADTQMPRGTTRRMVETLAHPLNTARLSADGQRVVGGCTIIQPRVSTSLPSAMATRFSRIFTDPTGIDPYTKAVSDVYQDLSGEGTYHGKGIYDPRVFHRVLGGWFPEQSLLSHDLIEGAHVRAGLASDIELLDEFPPDYEAYSSREHRWIRGDWQIAEYCLPRVPGPAGRGRGGVDNPLTGLNRWKVFDNLRRSLVPAASVALLAASWLATPGEGSLAAVVTTLIAVLLLFAPLSHLVTWATSRSGLLSRTGNSPLSGGEFRTGLFRAVATAMLLPHMAMVALDAVGRVWYRRRVSRRRLLEWTTAQVARPLHAFLAHLGLISLLSVATGAAIVLINPAALPAAAPFLLLWLVGPLAGWWLSRRPQRRPRRALLARDDVRTLRQIARETWRYFNQFVGPTTHWLPPDNYQVSHRNELASRTSPTNVGLWLLTGLAAHDLGYVTCDGLIERADGTFNTLIRLERYEGHLLNWYDIKTLQPLQPRYVSAVDSGNLIGCLWTFQQGLRQTLAGPLIGPEAIDGLSDTLSALRRSLESSSQDVRDAVEQPVNLLVRLLDDPPQGLQQIMERIRSAADPARLLASVLSHESAVGEPAFWANQLEQQVTAWLTLMDRYLLWVDAIANQPRESLALLGPEAVSAREAALGRAVSLKDLASGNVTSVKALLRTRVRIEPLPQAMIERLNQLADAFDRASWLSGEMLAAANRVLDRAQELADGMNLGFLYDRSRRLFSVGYNVTEDRLDRSFYDLLGSEARLASFVAIARGDVPVEHWLALARPYRSVRGRRVLLSWSGTMFEYMMPLLIQPLYRNSLLDQACRQAVAVQIDYAHRRGVPWGISESAFSALDSNQTYQYKAFGVPGLGLKRGLEEDLVVAPYASMLALPVAPAETVANLTRLMRLGLHGHYGLFESIDYSRRRGPGGERGVVVHAFMAHHQAMILLAIDNFLNEEAMPRRFHSDPRVRATESLLFERIPLAPPLFQVSMRDRGPERFAAEQLRPRSRFLTAATETPKTQLLSNGRYALMITNAGGGYSRWHEFDITRWRADTTADAWGSFCYLRDLDSGQAWSNTYHPMGSEGDGYSASFPVDHAEFRRIDEGIQTISEIVVSPEDDAEIRRITLVNRSSRARRIELTSYLELALAPHAADRSHPAFSKMFVTTEALAHRPGLTALLAWRRKRDPDDAPIWAAHLIVGAAGVVELAGGEGSIGGTGPGQSVQYETDRRRFIGRGRTLQDPQAIHGDLSNRTGAVLDPIFSLRRRITLKPGERVRLVLITLVGESREAVLALIEKYDDLRAVNRAMELAWSKAQLELRHLRVQPEEAQRFQQLAGHVLYPSPPLRPPTSRLRQNRLGQRRLWPHGVSGDEPIVAVTIGESRDMPLVREVLLAHNYWRMRGLKVDLVIVNEEMSGYDQPLHEQLAQMIQGHSMHTGIDQPGGVFLRKADQLPAEDVTLLLSAARAVLVATRGPLAQQLGVPGETVEEPPPLVISAGPQEEPSPPLPFMELPYFNGLGGFTPPDGREYAIYLGPGDQTPAPWVNVLANPDFGALVSESGSGFTWRANSQANRLTAWSNDPVTDPASAAIYIRDEESGTFWTPTPLPVRELDAYRARHGAGYTVFEHNSHAIEQELTTFVPMDENGGAPVCVQRLRLRSCSSRHRRLTVTFYAEWTLGADREQMQAHVISTWDAASRAMLARNAFHPDYGEDIAFASINPPAVSYTADRTMFLGRNGTLARPAAMRRKMLAGRTGAAMDPCAALQVTVELDPGESAEVVCLLGQAKTIAEAQDCVRRFRNPVDVEEALAATRTWWDHLLGRLRVQTPDMAANFLLNRWLLYQALACRMWARSAFYQSGGAFGFRDQLQDALALLDVRPALTRAHIVRAAGRQFLEGDVLHWWHPQTGAGVRTRCSDDLLWLPFAAAEYIRVTEDLGILDERIRFLEDRPLESYETEAFLTPAEAGEQGTLLEHCRRAIELALSRVGPHGLPLFGSGDWNDGLNRVGRGGKGESVWLAWFLIDVLNDFAELCGRRAEPEEEEADRYRQQARELAGKVEQHAWDGRWYARGYFDDGTPLGASRNKESRIDSLPQSWAVISGAGDPRRAEQALESAWELLVRREDRLVLLFTPPFDSSPLDPGYVKGYPPGVRENGGQYTHAALWLAMALARRGDGDRAVELLRMLNPVERARVPEDVARYRVEPYAVAADVYSAPGRVGQGGWSWYTGSASWTYRVWIEEVLGFKRRGERLLVQPAIPSDWGDYRVVYRHGRSTYDIHVVNPDGVSAGVAWIELDGERLPATGEHAIPLVDDGERHVARVHLGEASGTPPPAAVDERPAGAIAPSKGPARKREKPTTPASD